MTPPEQTHVQSALEKQTNDINKKIEEEFEKEWKRDCIPAPYGKGSGLYSPASLAVSRRKEAAKHMFKAAYSFHQSKISELKEKIDKLESKFKDERNDVLYLDNRIVDLEQENKELREALDWALENLDILLLLGTKNNPKKKKSAEIRQRFNLDKEVKK